MALTVGLASALLGGTAPLIEQLVVETTGLIGPGLYVAATAAVAALALVRWPETAFTQLPTAADREVAGRSRRA
jgi:MFS transporter, MHS family, proline/betaine transporter